MAEARRPPRPAMPPRPAVPARPAMPARPAPAAPDRPRSGAVVTGERPQDVSAPSTGAADEPQDTAAAWQVSTARRPRARATADVSAAEGSRLMGAMRRGTARGAGAAAEQLGNVTLRLQTRLKEQAAAQRRLSAIVWARRAGYVALAALLVWIVVASPVLALDPEQAEVSGFGTVVDPADVDAVIAEYEGTSLATLATARLADALREVPGVRDATIERVWPRGLLVELTSREPVAAVPDGEGGFWLVDAEATRVGRAGEAQESLPVVTVPVGEYHVRVLASVLGVVNQLPVALRERVSDVSASTEDTVTFELRDGPRVEWGSAEDSALKASVLQVLLDSGQARDASVIDVSAPTLPTTKK